MSTLGNIGKISVDELWNILLNLRVKDGEMHLASTTGDENASGAEIHYYQRRVWEAMQKQLEAIVQCVEEMRKTPIYAAPYQEVERAIKAVRKLERESESQKVTRRGVKCEDRWCFSNELAFHMGEKVIVRLEGKFLEVWSMDGKLIAGIPWKKNTPKKV